MYDYCEELAMDSETASLLGLPRPRHERRPCLLRSITAAALWAASGRVPPAAQVDKLAAGYRLQLASSAAAVAQALGPAEDRVAAGEAEVRLHLHDALTADHDKDFRVLACLPLAELRSAVLVVLWVDYTGGSEVETVTGEDANASSACLWVLIHRGHMRMLVPPPDVNGQAWLSQLARPPLDSPSHGWEFYVDHAREEPATVDGDVAGGCRSCCAALRRAGPRPRAVGASGCGWSVRFSPALPLPREHGPAQATRTSMGRQRPAPGRTPS